MHHKVNCNKHQQSHLHKEVQDKQWQYGHQKVWCAVTDHDQCAQHDAGRVKAHEEGHGQLHVDGVYVLGKAIHYAANRGRIKEYHGSVQNSVQHLLVNDS